jgi:hypothetical protein
MTVALCPYRGAGLSPAQRGLCHVMVSTSMAHTSFRYVNLSAEEVGGWGGGGRARGCERERQPGPPFQHQHRRPHSPQHCCACDAPSPSPFSQSPCNHAHSLTLHTRTLPSVVLAAEYDEQVAHKGGRVPTPCRWGHAIHHGPAPAGSCHTPVHTHTHTHTYTRAHTDTDRHTAFASVVASPCRLRAKQQAHGARSHSHSHSLLLPHMASMSQSAGRPHTLHQGAPQQGRWRGREGRGYMGES